VPGTGRLLTEPSGSFGGLTLPANVATTRDGKIYLLDIETSQLKTFDPCECRFVMVPCIGGEGHGIRQFKGAQGIGIRAGNLFVCDTENHRLSVFSLHGLVFRTAWLPPDSEALAFQWEPTAVTFDGCGRVFVGDRANGCIHRFSPFGLWEDSLPGFEGVTDIVVDQRNWLYAIVGGDEAGVRVLDLRSGEPHDTAPRIEAVEAYFRKLPFEVDAHGNLYLDGLCDPRHSDAENANSQQNSGVFDRNGNPLTTVPVPEFTRYETKGCFLSEALDSKIYRCQWHRVVLRGRIPPDGSVSVLTYTSETQQPQSRISDLGNEAWDTNQHTYQMENGEWDCLVRSGGGRYLWFKLEFVCNGLSTPNIESIRLEFPRVSLRRFLPAVFSADPESADFADRFLSIFDTTLRSIETQVDDQATYFDPDSAPTKKGPDNRIDVLSWLACWIGESLDRHWPEKKRRLYVKNAARLHHMRGTRYGLWHQLLFFLGMEPERLPCPTGKTQRCCGRSISSPNEKFQISAWQPPDLILEHYQLRRWMFLGKGRLGDQAILWGKRIVNRSQLNENAQVDRTQLITTQDPLRDPFHVYAHKFSVFVPASFGRCDCHRKGLDNLLKKASPGHTENQIIYVEPRFRIGFQSMIGFDSVVGMYPEGVVLDGKVPLGRDSVLGSDSDVPGEPLFQIGKRARMGTTTKLN
jgi:phage tail-like protein